MNVSPELELAIKTETRGTKFNADEIQNRLVENLQETNGHRPKTPCGSKSFLFLKPGGMLPGMLKGERVASLSEAHAQSIRERSAKGRVGQQAPSIANHGRRHSFCNWVLEFRAWVSSPQFTFPACFVVLRIRFWS